MVFYKMYNIDSFSVIRSGLSKILVNGEPQILFTEKTKRNGETRTFEAFGIIDILEDLFLGYSDDSKIKHEPLISLAYIPKAHKDLVSFILPATILEKTISSAENIKESGNHNFYQDFLLNTPSNKFTICLHKLICDYGLQKFVEEVRKHIVVNLSSIDLSNNEELKKYLTHVGAKTIVPNSLSKESNNAFLKLLDMGTSESLSTIIANFLISAMLGLRYLLVHKEYDYKKKIYLLNELGTKYIWCPALLTTTYEHLQNIQQQYAYGKYNVVYRQLLKWINDNKNQAPSAELALAYQLMGSCMFNFPEECQIKGKLKADVRSQGIEYLLESEKQYDTIEQEVSEIYYQLYECFMASDCDIHDHTKALEYLKKAFLKYNARAIIKFVEITLNKSVGNDSDVTDSMLLHYLSHVVDSSGQYSDNELRQCLYYRGLLMDKLDNKAAAEADFIAAAQKGHEKARQRIVKKARDSQSTMPVFLQQKTQRICYTNSLSGNNFITLSTFPSEEWIAFSTDTETKSRTGVVTVDSIDEFIERLDSNNLSLTQQIVILLMSDDRSKNLNDCLLFLDKLFNIALEASDNEKKALIDSVDIYIEADYETAAMLIDASLSDMGDDIFFKVHIKDEKKEAAHQLLCDAPLFIPFLDKATKEKSANVILLGSTDANYQIIKEAIACAYMGKNYPITITMLGELAEHYEARLRQECPGIFQKDHIFCIIPNFTTCDLSELDFPSYIHGVAFNELSEDHIVKALKVGNYFVVDLDNDLSSIHFAADLRTWLLRSRGTFDRAPFIGVKCSDARSAYLSKHLAVSGRSPGDTYYSNYNLFAFGISKTMFSYERMIKENRLEKIAFHVHESYDTTSSPHQVENGFYSYSYNMDSSICTAIGLPYRLFVAGVHFNDTDAYQNGGVFEASELYDTFSDKIKNKDALEAAAALEQSRFNGYALSRGWLPADASQVAAYSEQATGSSHRHLLAKLHPFILEWSDIEDEKIRKTLNILKSKFSYKNSPQEITRRSIRDTARFVERTASKTTER